MPTPLLDRPLVPRVIAKTHPAIAATFRSITSFVYQVIGVLNDQFSVFTLLAIVKVIVFTLLAIVKFFVFTLLANEAERSHCVRENRKYPGEVDYNGY